MTDEKSTRIENPDDTFTALLDDYGTDMYTLGNGGYGKGGGVKESRDAIKDYFSGMMAAHNAQLDIANAEIERLKARQITPEMESNARAYYAWLVDMKYPTEADIHKGTSLVFVVMTMLFKVFGLKE